MWFTLISLLFYSSSVQCFYAEVEWNLKDYHMSCLEITNAPPEHVVQLITGNMTVDNIALKNWAFCVMMKMGVMDKDSIIHMDRLLHKMPSADHLRTSEIVKNCLIPRVPRQVNYTWEFFKCYHEQDPKHRFI